MLATEIGAKLTAAGLTTGYEVRRNTMPISPDKVIALYEGGGSGPRFFLNEAGIGIEEPTLQVRVRGEANDADGPLAKLQVIYQAMASWGAFTQSGVRYMSLTPLQSPFPLHRDKNERVEFAVNFLVQKEPSTT